MRLLFVRSQKPASRLIRWGLDEEVSHVAVEFSSGLVIHSTFSGVTLQWIDSFLSEDEIVYSLPVTPTEGETEIDLMSRVMHTYWKRGYDYWAFTYFSWRVFLRKFLDIPLPEKNRFNHERSFLCTELAGVIVGQEVSPMITPLELYDILTGSTHSQHN